MTASRPDSSACTVRSIDRDSIPSADERTPLLEHSQTSASILQSKISFPGDGSAMDVPDLREAQLENGVSDSPKDVRGTKAIVNVASVLPVLLLGANSRYPHLQMRYYQKQPGLKSFILTPDIFCVYRSVHLKRRWINRVGHLWHHVVGAG